MMERGPFVDSTVTGYLGPESEPGNELPVGAFSGPERSRTCGGGTLVGGGSVMSCLPSLALDCSASRTEIPRRSYSE